MRRFQQELIDRTESGENYDELAKEILHLRKLQEQIVMDDVARAAHWERIQELRHSSILSREPSRNLMRFW